jgi:glycerol-3-phosphate dehydrogenase
MGLLDYNTSDGRFLFMLPWEKHTLIGTTDTKGPAETLPNPPEDEVEWLLAESRKYLTPDMKVRRSDVLSAWRGWRPLAVDPHAAPGAPASRDHVISENPGTGVIFIAGVIPPKGPALIFQGALKNNIPLELHRLVTMRLVWLWVQF